MFVHGMRAIVLWETSFLDLLVHLFFLLLDFVDELCVITRPVDEQDFTYLDLWRFRSRI